MLEGSAHQKVPVYHMIMEHKRDTHRRDAVLWCRSGMLSLLTTAVASCLKRGVMPRLPAPCSRYLTRSNWQKCTQEVLCN